MDKSQTICKNRILTHLYTNQPRKPNHSLCSNQPGTIRTLSVTASFPNVCLYFQLRTNQRKPNKLLKPIMWDVLLLVSPSPASQCQQTPVRAYLKSSLSFFCFSSLENFPTPLSPLSFSSTQMMVADSLASASSEQIASVYFPLGGFCIHSIITEVKSSAPILKFHIFLLVLLLCRKQTS